MANFHRDRDLDAFDHSSDVTFAPPHTSPIKAVSKAGGATRPLATGDDDALASLRKRMAGPSSAKAGLAIDQDEINRKIYEASKGSKYFENEKRNDERITRQIEAMLDRRDKNIQHTPEGSEAWLSIERKIDDRVIALEAQRDLSRIILHADMDMFYAAVELKRDPSLKGKAFAVGSGVLVTASYEARKMGCRSGMATHVALALCPHLIVVKNDMASYVSASKEVMAIIEQYDADYAQMSLDEAYLDITPYCEQNETSADAVVAELRDSVRQQTGLTVSVGIAPNKMLAKISSDRNKPNGQFRVEPNRNFIIDLMQDLPCRKIPGIGRVTERILSSLGVNTCGDIWRQRTMLHLTLGEIDWLLNAYLGIHSNIVEPSKRGERRSVGREHTFSPTKDVTLLKEYLKQSVDKVAEDLQRLDYRGKCITLTCKTDRFRRFTRAKTVNSHLYRAQDLYSVVIKLLDAEFAAQGGPFSMRLIGVRVSALIDLREPEQGGIRKMFEQTKSARQAIGKDDNDGQTFCEISFEEAMQRALEQSADEQQEREKSRSSTPLSTSAVIIQRTKEVVCPICEREIDIPPDAAHSETLVNLALNEHVDLCLIGDSYQAPPKRSPDPNRGKSWKANKKQRPNPSATLDRFFRRPT